jgi:hypothetical protein
VLQAMPAPMLPMLPMLSSGVAGPTVYMYMQLF